MCVGCVYKAVCVLGVSISLCVFVGRGSGGSDRGSPAAGGGPSMSDGGIPRCPHSPPCS